ncbi:MAG: hypothetical protein ACRC67_06690 [Inquilinus sp.]|uniref:hypothetical protein n=1 Tax=Inquilinus sp. TaxID=1932117 RepID=UPI003F3F4A19
MPLLAIWNSSPEAINEFSIDQVVAAAGDGNLKDGSTCAEEFRSYLAQIPSEKLGLYVDRCLSSPPLPKGGIILQDLVNELGRRLDYKVTNGRYQGTPNTIGFDGIWVSPEGQTIIIEVKTTDAYRISLDTIVTYRQKLLDSGTVTGESSILLVVGREDTGELEAQVRGSRHAWDIRLISAEALINLVKLKENSDDIETGKKIRSVLTPVEYTRLDRLVDVMFTAATDVEPNIPESDAELPALDSISQTSGHQENGGWELTDSALLHQKREQIIDAVSKKFGSALIKKSRALFWTPDHTKRIVCTLSKRYAKRPTLPYWYAYHPQWDEFLVGGSEGYLVLGGMDLGVAFMIPRKEIHALLDGLHTTDGKHGTYWHIHISEEKAGHYGIYIPKKSKHAAVSQYIIGI